MSWSYVEAGDTLYYKYTLGSNFQIMLAEFTQC